MNGYYGTVGFRRPRRLAVVETPRVVFLRCRVNDDAYAARCLPGKVRGGVVVDLGNLIPQRTAACRCGIQRLYLSVGFNRVVTILILARACACSLNVAVCGCWGRCRRRLHGFLRRCLAESSSLYLCRAFLRLASLYRLARVVLALVLALAVIHAHDLTSGGDGGDFGILIGLILDDRLRCGGFLLRCGDHLLAFFNHLANVQRVAFLVVLYRRG